MWLLLAAQQLLRVVKMVVEVVFHSFFLSSFLSFFLSFFHLAQESLGFCRLPFKCGKLALVTVQEV